MSDSSEKPWSNNPTAPQIPHLLYSLEKGIFAGILIGAIFYGVVIVLFIQCLGALFDPVNRMRTGIKWGFAAHTAVMFLAVTITVAMDLNSLSVSYVEDREFPGDDESPPGPAGYQYFTYTSATSDFSRVMFPLNQWLADGILLYRCHVIYAMNFRAIVFPCLVYLTSIAMGITYIYQTVQPGYLDSTADITIDVPLSYFWISLSLNVLLTLMIVIQLILHRRNVRIALGSLAGTTGLYTAVVTTLVESSAPYAVAFLLVIGAFTADSYLTSAFTPLLGDIQVIAPFLIILRVANKRALTSDTTTSASIGSIHFKSHGGSASDHGTVTSDRNIIDSMEAGGEAPGEHGVGAEQTIEEVPL